MASYTGPTYTSETYVGEVSTIGEGITPAPVDSEQDVPGPAWGTALTPAPVDSAQVVNPPTFPPPAAYQATITPASVDTAQKVPGPMIVTPNPSVPVVPVGANGEAPYVFEVVDYPDALSFDCQPQINDVGHGNIVIRRNPGDLVMGEIVGFNLLGNRIFTGRVATRLDTVHDVGEEAAQTLSVTVDGMLSEWEFAVVYPDFGAQDVSRLGPPTQDIRVFDWTMNGGLGEESVNVKDSVKMTNRYGQSNEVFPLPDVWPAPYAEWMWASDPANTHQPAGWVYFREPFGVTEDRLQVWCCAYDYAEVWLDGVPILTCDQPGIAQHIDLEVRQDFHLITIRAHNGGGKAGVLAALMPVDSDGLYGEPYRLSRGGWKTLAYPSASFRLNPAEVLIRLRLEARRRGVRDFDSWEFDFNETYDSAGRPWPPGEPFSFEVGMTYLDVLRRMAEDRVDFAAAPSDRRLRMWVKDQGTGIDHTPNPWDPDSYTSYTREQTIR